MFITRTPLVCFDADEKPGGATATADAPDPTKDDQPDPKKDGDQGGRTVPLSELQKERKARQQVETRLAELEAEAQERRKAEMSEVERLKEELAQAQREADAAKTESSRSQKQGWLRDAAIRHGFIDPTDAVARIGTDDIEDERGAGEAVKKLAAKAEHLVKKPDPKPGLDEVLRDGKRPDDNPGDTEELFTREQLDQLTPEQVNANWDRVQKSLSALR